MSTEKRTIVEVHWIDAWGGGSSSYYHSGDDYTGLDVWEIGYLMETNDKTVVLCSSVEVARHANGRHLTVIPWEYIISIEELI